MYVIIYIILDTTLIFMYWKSWRYVNWNL